MGTSCVSSSGRWRRKRAVSRPERLCAGRGARGPVSVLRAGEEGGGADVRERDGVQEALGEPALARGE